MLSHALTGWRLNRKSPGLLPPVLLAIVLLATACGSASSGGSLPGQSNPDTLQPAAIAGGEKLRVVATTNIVGDIVGQIGLDRIALTTLMGIGVDPHSYVAIPSDVAAIHEAHVIFANGVGLESFLEDLLENAGGSAVVISLSDGLSLQAPPESLGETGDEDDHSRDGDPHVWFDVQNVIAWTATIELALSRLDPSNAATYEESASTYRRDLKALDTWIVNQVGTLPEANRKLVTNHPAFGYLAARYGLEQVGAVYPISPSAEPSARDIAHLEDMIRKLGVPAVFTESTVNAKLAEQVAHDTGVKVVALYSGSLGGPGSGAASYLELMRYDVVAIVEALR